MCRIHIDKNARQMCYVLKVSTTLSMIDVITASLKIAGLISNSIPKEDWKTLAESNDADLIHEIISKHVTISDTVRVK